VKTKEKNQKTIPKPEQIHQAKKKKKKLTGARPTASVSTEAVVLGGQPDLGRPWVHCACTVGLQTHVFFFFLLFLFSLLLYSFSFLPSFK
jgi:hypothetical protein